ncbi:MAG: T9SS type A sorting domain-containing protein, partial [bacterium]|nr:T9SS type A sorting domain-containing protein [bacterium]
LVNSCSTFDDLGYDVTCSAVNISILSAAAQNLKSLTGRLRQLPVSAYVNPAAVSDSVLSFPLSSYDLPGMLDFIGAGLPEPEKGMVLDASRQFKNSVMAQAIVGDENQKANGLAAWYPIGKYNFEGGIDLYSNLQWSGLSGWDKLLYHLIFQQDSTAPVPQNVTLAQGTGGLWKLAWENGYEPSGIESYQIRRSQNLTTTFSDQGGNADSSNWVKTGFTIASGDDGDTAYYSIGGQMTSKNAIQFDSSGNVGFTAEGIWGSLILESSADTSLEWDTLGFWNFYGEGPPKYCSAKVKTAQARIRISWNTSHSGWVYIDGIKVCHPDATKEIEEVNSSFPFYILSNHPGTDGFYQIRSVDSLQNQSSWSDAVFYLSESGVARVWPNPFKDKVFILFSSSTERLQEVKIFNILGQFIDRMSLQKKAINGRIAEYLYYWDPKSSIAGGIYIAQLNSDTGVRAVKMILIR